MGMLGEGAGGVLIFARVLVVIFGGWRVRDRAGLDGWDFAWHLHSLLDVVQPPAAAAQRERDGGRPLSAFPLSS